MRRCVFQQHQAAHVFERISLANELAMTLTVDC